MEFSEYGTKFPSLDSIKEKRKKAFDNSKKLNHRFFQTHQQKQLVSVILNNCQILFAQQIEFHSLTNIER